jgi:transcriptional regulator of acetoin/glycerol metabolism
LALEGSDGDRLVQPKALARELKPLPQRVDLGAADLERARLACEGTVTQAARALGLPSRYSLYRLRKRFGVPIER